jgi:hypothetical protein
MLPEVLFFLEGYIQISKNLTHTINFKYITTQNLI